MRFEFDRLDVECFWHMIGGLDLPKDVEMTDC